MRPTSENQVTQPETRNQKLETLYCGKFHLSLNRPLIMGIINITPDSFSDGGKFYDPEKAIHHAKQLIEEGADILDVGAESSRPGSQPVELEEELRRLRPVLEGLRDSPIPISVDTYKPKVMQVAIEMGASLINDINAFQALGAFEVVKKSDVALCLMHKQNDPQTMQINPTYNDVVAEVKSFLKRRIEAAVNVGIVKERLLIDPGFGFGKTLEHNLNLLRNLETFKELDVPILVGLSRKSMLGQITGNSVTERLHASLAAALLAAERGAKIVRVHDVAATKEVLTVWSMILGNRG